MGDSINVLLDDILALLTRLFLFPVAFQLFMYATLTLIFWWLAFKLMGFFKKPISIETKKLFVISSIAICINIGAIALFDYKNNLRELELNKQSFQIVPSPVGDSLTINTSSLMQGFADSLSASEGETTSTADCIIKDNGLEVFCVRQDNPLVVYYLAAIDLHQYDVVLDSIIDKKELTSSFAKRMNIDIAVNGEAGTSPGDNAPLGQWTGNYMVDGKIILLKDNARRPFVSFDEKNTATYSAESEIVTSYPKEIRNVIWGRFDLINNGALSISPYDGTQNNPYPRTVVGLNKDGDKLFLLVVDGRNPNHSRGLKMKDCGEILLKAGCHFAMACDQGGSSAMYHKKLGVFTRPADGHERVVYTHLGFRKK
jgi:hypothetical protein